MNELLELALSAHGGLERWREVQTIDLKLSITGGLFRIKGFPEGLPNVSMHIEAQRPAVNITPYKTSDGRGYFTPLSSNEEFLRSKRSELCLRRVWIARVLRPRSGTIGRARPPVCCSVDRHVEPETPCQFLLDSIRRSKAVKKTLSEPKPRHDFFGRACRDSPQSHHGPVPFSMGGIVFRLQVTHSVRTLWNGVFRPKADTLYASQPNNSTIKQALLFPADPIVKRVIFVATAHRGSSLSTSSIGALGIRLIRLPVKVLNAIPNAV